MRAIVVRHYKTLLNASDQILGWGDAPRVKGWRADIARVEEALQKHAIEFDVIYSSALERARQTAMFYARQRGIPVIHDIADLNEVNYGSLYRKSKKWVANNIPQHKKDPDFVYPEGESFRQMQQRSARYLQFMAGRNPQKTILLVVHAGVIRGLVSHFLGLDYAAQLKRKISHRYIGEFLFEGTDCVRYDEFGKSSGFVRDGVIEIPRVQVASSTAVDSAYDKKAL
jgi:broad specificity phosphatase PhoE